MDVNMIKWIEEQVTGLSESEIKRAVLDGVNGIRSASGVYGCYCDLENYIDQTPDECVLDLGYPSTCVYAISIRKNGKTKWDCEYWRKINVESK